MANDKICSKLRPSLRRKTPAKLIFTERLGELQYKLRRADKEPNKSG